MRHFIVLAIFSLAIYHCESRSLASDLDAEFAKFKVEFNRVYGSAAEEEKRKAIFAQNLEFFDKHNKEYEQGIHTHFVGVTQFADMTREEIRGFMMPNPNELTVTNTTLDPYEGPVTFASVPATWDWKAQGKVGVIKNQGQCGSCWAFASVAVTESLYAIAHNQLVSLSEQELVDCSNSNCGGNYINTALDMIKAHGLQTEAAYPYHSTNAKAGTCQGFSGTYKIGGYKSIGANGRPAADETIMQAVHDIGPAAIMFDAEGDEFAHYKGGILTVNQSAWKASHAVALIGWGSEGGKDYWLVKNSWGTGWGEQGYIRWARGMNMRHMNEFVFVPTA